MISKHAKEKAFKTDACFFNQDKLTIFKFQWKYELLKAFLNVLWTSFFALSAKIEIWSLTLDRKEEFKGSSFHVQFQYFRKSVYVLQLNSRHYFVLETIFFKKYLSYSYRYKNNIAQSILLRLEFPEHYSLITFHTRIL